MHRCVICHWSYPWFLSEEMRDEERESVRNVCGRCAVIKILLDCSGGSWLTGSGLSEEPTNWRSSAWIKKTVNYCARKEPTISHSLLLAATLFRCLVHMCMCGCGVSKSTQSILSANQRKDCTPWWNVCVMVTPHRPCCVGWIIMPDWSLLRFRDRKHSGAIDCCACTPLRVCVCHMHTHTPARVITGINIATITRHTVFFFFRDVAIFIQY